MFDLMVDYLPWIIILLIIIDAGVLYIFHLRVVRIRKQAREHEEENQRLSKYRSIEDAEAKAKQIVQSAKSVYERANGKGVAIVEDATKSAAAVVSEAQERAKGLYDASWLESTQIVEAARKHAEEIAGEALEAKSNVEIYEKAIKAIQNKMDGYGNEYLVPPHSLLDELADSFGHAEAGRALHDARDKVRSMIKHAVAATSSYIDARRRQKAIEFVLDYFNAKADDILSRVKHDNYGKLAQEMRDAFSIVNVQGLAFRDARITSEFLDARLNELRWATIVHQLKLDEREEQRRIREQIREEAKAHREYERAIREAAKEQDMLRVAMEKARYALEEAKEEQRAKYENQLQELSRRLKEAEERNQRALSMAQQTKNGHVYIISNIGSLGENVYKIGLTRRLEPLERVRELGDASVPFDFDVHAVIFSEDAPALESQLHKHFVFNQLNKINRRKEFFRVELRQIREEIESLGINANWTMTAKATQYHESVAMERLMKDNPAMREAWLQKQLILSPAIDEIQPEALSSDEDNLVAAEID